MRASLAVYDPGTSKPQRGPAWPHLPWRRYGGRYRLPMLEPSNEAIAVRIEALWKRDDLSDADRRMVLKISGTLSDFDIHASSVLGGVAPVLASIERLEQQCGLLHAVN